MENNNRAMKKENIYIDLSKCTEEELKQVITKIFSSDSPVATLTRYILEKMMVHKFNGTPYLLINKFNHWKLNETDMGKTELTYPEFIKLFNGGDEVRTQLLPDASYWRYRCLLAEKCLSVSPCDPDITDEQIKAHKDYNEYLETFGKKD